MDPRLSPLVLPLATATLVAWAMALYAWRRRAVPGARSLALLMASLGVWMLTSGLEYWLPSFEEKVLVSRVRHFGIYGALMAWLQVTLLHTGREAWLTRRRLTLLAAVPLTTLLLICTNDVHHLHWAAMRLDPAGPGLLTEHGPWFWVHLAFIYSLLLGTTLLVLVEGQRTPSARPLAIPLVLAVALPWLCNASQTFGFNPWPSTDPTPYALILSALGFGFALFRLGFLDISPVAHGVVVASLPDGVLVLDVRRRVVELNPAAEGVLGCQAAAARGRPLEELLGDWPEEARRALPVREGQAELSLGRPARSYEARAAELHGPGGRVAGSVLVLRDITDERQAERLREDLSHALVHDMRGPLTGLLGSLDALGHDEAHRLDARQQQLLSVGRSAATRLTRLVDSVLEVSRLESGQVPLRTMPLFPEALVAQCLERHALPASHRQVKLAAAVAPGAPPALADPDLLQRVLDNLIGNAVKFVPPGGTVRLAAGREDGELLLEVSDDGPGLPPEVRGRVFEKFVTGGQKGRGTGLGLAFCRLAVEAHGGRIWTESSEGGGAVFRFTLPLA